MNTSESNHFSPEYKDISEYYKEVLVNALTGSFEIWRKLGERGKDVTQKNQYGDSALLADIEIERSIIDYFKKIGLPIKVCSEEHGVVDLGNPQLLAVLDGLDGSRVFTSDREHGRYGTMLGIYNGNDPVYDDYITGGILEHSTGNLYFAEKSEGSFRMNVQNGKKVRIFTSAEQDIHAPNVKIYIDEFFEVNKANFSRKLNSFQTIGYNLEHIGSSSRSYMDVASGQAEFALECTRKGNLEIASAYPLIHEAGGVMIDLHGESINGQNYLKYGQKEQIPMITAANKTIAEQLIKYLSQYE